MDFSFRRQVTLSCVVLVALPFLTPHPGFSQDIPWDRLSLAQGADLNIGEEGSTDSESTVVKLPFAITVKKPEAGRIGVKLRAPVYFSWNHTKISDIDGDDISYSLKTLVITPGVEVLIPVGERWMLRPFAEFGAISALDIGEHAWLGSTGMRASSSWDLTGWRLTAGGKVQYTLAWTEDWKTHDDVGSLEIGGGAGFPLWFDFLGDRPTAGFFFFPRWYFEDLIIEGAEGVALQVDRHLELGLSFELPRQPKVIGIKLPAWYGVGYRFADDYGAWRIYLGFPF
ncbi:MAG: hypothetical protein ABFS37_15780 [Acidobacteriota bacterium]